MTETAQETINSLKNLLRESRSEAQKILKEDRRVAEWAEAEIARYAPMLMALKINHQEVDAATKNIVKSATTTLQEAKKWENALSNIEADIRLKSKPEKEVAAEALRLKQSCRELPKRLENLRRQKGILDSADAIIFGLLTLDRMLPVAESLIDRSQKNRDVFPEGLAVYRQVADKGPSTSPEFNIHQLEKKAKKVELALNKIEFPKLPELAKVALQCHLNTCRSAVGEIFLYIGAISRSLVPEMRKIEEIEQALEQLQGKPLAATLEGLKSCAVRLRRYISEFEYKTNLIKDIRKAAILLDNLAVFAEAFRDAYLPHLAQKTGEAGSILDPQRLARQNAAAYFNGLKGLLRLLKLLLAAGSTSGPLNEQTLTEKISIALTTCPYYYCQDEKQTDKVTEFIESLIGGYSKPYPHDALFQLIIKSIDAYGSLIEKDFQDYKTDKSPLLQDETSGTTGPSLPAGMQLGPLINKIQIRTVQIKSLHS